MSKPYWSYETSSGDNTCVSIRTHKRPFSLSDYFHYLGKFISRYSHRITKVCSTSVLFDGSYCTIIEMIGREPIFFENQG